MDSLLSRYRNLTVLVLAILAQLLLLAYQVRSNQDVRLIRIWAVTAVTPLARTLEAVRSSVTGFFGNYFVLHDLRQENQRMLRELGRLKMENQFLKTELSTADRARTLSVFQSRTPSRTVAGRVIGIGPGAGSKAVYVDRGSLAGVQKGMAVVTPDGIVGKVMSVFPTASQVLLITDPTFAAGVISEKHRVRGTLKGLGYSTCRVDYVQNEETLDVGEAFFTSGDDRVFPKGLPVGRVKVARHGGSFKDILIDPSGLQGGLEEVLIVLEGVHQELPDQPAANSPIYLAPAPPAESSGAPQVEPARPTPPVGGTDADRLRERYRALGEAQNHKFGEGGPGARPPDFTGVRNPLAPQPAAVPKPTGQVPGQIPVQPPAAAKPKIEPPAAATPPGAQQ